MTNSTDTISMLASNIISAAGGDIDTDWLNEGETKDTRPASTHPMQPLVEDEHGVIRFKKNAIVSDMLDRDAANGGQNKIAYEVITGKHTHEDYSQLMQLIGYSVSGYGDLSIVPKADRDNADIMAAAFMATLPRYKKEPSE